MRTLVDLPQEQVDELDRLSKAERRSRAALIRAAIADYLKEHKRADRKAAFDAAFGSWADIGIDGLEYQERMRAEWDRDPAA